ncbi:MAG: SlyX family protein [Paracoccaceae bacterium]|jgi:SlyX protein
MDKTENKETNSRLTENEAKISYLIKDIEDLSDIVAKQSRELEKLNKKVSFLIQKETERDDISGVVLSDKPPHW